MAKLNEFRAACERWQKRLGLTDWNITVQAEVLGEPTASGFKTGAETVPDIEYRGAVIKADPVALAGWDKEDVEVMASHEVVHLLWAPVDSVLNSAFSEMGNDRAKALKDWHHSETEVATERTARAFRKAKW